MFDQVDVAGAQIASNSPLKSRAYTRYHVDILLTVAHYPRALSCNGEFSSVWLG